MERLEEEKVDKVVHRLRANYEAEKVKKQKRQIQVFDEIRENNKSNKKLLFPSRKKKGGRLMKKAKKEFLNSREVLNLKALKFSREIIPSSSSSSTINLSPPTSKLFYENPPQKPERYEVEENKKQKRQIQFLQEIPTLPAENNEKKRKIAPSSSSSTCGKNSGKLMEKAEKDFLNSEVRSTSSVVTYKVSSTFDHSLPITRQIIPEDQEQIPPKKKRYIIRFKLPSIQKSITISKEDYLKESRGEKD